MKKLLSVLIIFSTLFAHNVQALGPVTEIGGNLWTNIANTTETIWSSGVKEILEPAVEKLAERALDKVVDDTLRWAGSDQGYISNWDGWLKGTQHDVFDKALKYSEKTYKETEQTNQCNAEVESLRASAGEAWDKMGEEAQKKYKDKEEYIKEYVAQNISGACKSILGNAIGTDSASAAQQNYNTHQDNAQERSTTAALADHGAKQLNNSQTESAIGQKEETLTAVVGSSDAKYKFKTQFVYGGWLGYLALVEPSNTEVGTISMSQAAVSYEAAQETQKAIDNQQTEVKFLDKTRCTATQDGECVREETTTPGPQVAAKVDSALTKDEQVAANSDGLIGSLIKSAVGKLTKGLTNIGIEGLTRKAISIYNSSNSSSPSTASSNQSSYDILGIQNDGFGNQSSPITNIDYTNTSGSGGGGFIGGPEDEVLGFGGPQIIIDLKEDLEKNINLAKEEQAGYEEIELLRADNKDIVIGLDRCLPGPDYNWETRFNDVYSRATDSTFSQLNSLALSETRKMTNDPKINIPGSQIMKETVESIIGQSRQENLRDRQRLEALRRVTSSLTYIKSEILTDFSKQKATSADRKNLVLFYEDWEKLTKAQQVDAFTTALANGFHVLKDDEKLDSTETLVTKKGLVAASAVIDMAWDIWRTETPTDRKNDLRFEFYTRENDLSSEEYVARIKAEVNRTKNEILKAVSILQDCIVLKAFTFRVDPTKIQTIVYTGDPKTIESIRENINLLGILMSSEFNSISSGMGPLGSPLLNPFSMFNSEINTIDVDNAMPDLFIKAFLVAQHNNQLNNAPSLFITSAVTGDIENSILGFANETEKNEYFDKLYPYGDFPYPLVTNNAKQIRHLYKADLVWVGYPLVRGFTGLLFCRHKGEVPVDIKVNPSNPFILGSACLYPWYIASELDYSIALAGV